MEFEWDERKAAANLNKHGVSFHEGAQSSEIRWQSLSMTPIILELSSGFLRSGYHGQIGYGWWRTQTGAEKHESLVRA